MKKTAIFLSLILLTVFCIPAIASAEISAPVEVMVNAGYSSIVALNQYGRVFSAGDNSDGQLMTYGWKNAVAVCAGRCFSAALLDNGKVVIAGKCEDGSEIDTSEFENITQIAAGDNFIAALDINGNVFVAGDRGSIDVSNWQNIKKIACGKKHIVAVDYDGNCLGSGSTAAESVETFSNIDNIYAGANLTVLKDFDGKLYHTGLGVYTKDADGQEVGSEWICGSWEEDIKDIKVIPGVNDVGVVVAVTNGGKIITDGTYIGLDVEWSQEFLDELLEFEDVKDVAIFKFRNNYFATIVKNDLSFQYIMNDSAINEFTETLDTFDLEMIPLNYEVSLPQVVTGPRTIGVLLPDRSVATIGKTSLEGFNGAKNLSVTKSYTSSYEISDYFLGVTDDGFVLTNLQDAEKAEAGIDAWRGVEKAESYYWQIDNNTTDPTQKDNRLIGALRWDKRLYSSYDNSKNVKNYKNIIDIAGGKFFTAALDEDGKVYVESYNTATDLSDVSTWTGIVKIFAGQNHVVGIKADGTCVSAGKNKNGVYFSGDLSSWTNIKEVACGNNYTIGLDYNGVCHYASYSTGKAYVAQMTAVDAWGEVDEIYGSDMYALAHKNDGTFVYAYVGTNQSKFEIPLINNAYYKDNLFHIYQIDGNKATIEHYSDRDIDAYISYFDDGNPVGFEKAILEGTESFTKTEFSNDDATECFLSIGEPTATKLNFYIEGLEGEGNTAEISYCASSATDLYITYFDAYGEAVDFKKATLPVSEGFKSITYTSNKNATSYVACFGEPLAEKLGFYMNTAVSGDGSQAEIEYCSAEDTQAYISYFDALGNAVGFEKVLLTASEKLTKAECKGEMSAATYKIAIGTPTSEKLDFYMEEESAGEGNTVSVNYCSAENVDLYITYFDINGEAVDFKKAELAASKELVKEEFKSEIAAVSYKMCLGEAAASKLTFYVNEGTGEGSTAVIEYCALEDTDAYISYFDSEGNAVDFKKIILTSSEKLIKAEYTGEDAKSHKISIGKPLAGNLGFYMSGETEGEGNEVSAEYCADKATDIYITYFDASGDPIDFKKMTLPAAETLTAFDCTSEKTAGSYVMTIGKPVADKLKFYMNGAVEGAGNKATIEYCSDNETTVYITYFDALGNPIDFSKTTLTATQTLKKVTCESEKAAATYRVAIGTPNAEKLGFYIEKSVENGVVSISYCADEARRIFVAFYDDENIMRDVKARSFEESFEIKNVTYSCDKATNYKLLIWDGVTPLYEEKGALR